GVLESRHRLKADDAIEYVDQAVAGPKHLSFLPLYYVALNLMKVSVLCGPFAALLPLGRGHGYPDCQRGAFRTPHDRSVLLRSSVTPHATGRMWSSSTAGGPHAQSPRSSSYTRRRSARQGAVLPPRVEPDQGRRSPPCKEGAHDAAGVRGLVWLNAPVGTCCGLMTSSEAPRPDARPARSSSAS